MPVPDTGEPPSEPWYYLYSYWSIILVILQVLKLTSFSAMPSVILVFFSVVGFCLWKNYVGIPYNITYVLIQVGIHCVPFLLIPLRFTQRDVLINVVIFCIYCVFLYIMGISFNDIYTKVAHEDGRVTLIGFLKSRKVILS